MKQLTSPIMLLCFLFSTPCQASTEKWCGTYFEKDGRAFIRLARDDLGVGSNTCNHSDYQQSVAQSGTANIALDFAKYNSTINNWRKFSNHLIEIRGKYHNGSITNTRFIRDMGS